MAGGRGRGLRISGGVCMVTKSIDIGGEDYDPVAAALYRVLTGLGTLLPDGMYCWCHTRSTPTSTIHTPACQTARKLVASLRVLED